MLNTAEAIRVALRPIAKIVRKRERDFLGPRHRSLAEVRGDSELFRLFSEHQGRKIHKWVHYLDLYDRHFSLFKEPRFLELGMFDGGSLELWRKYFGPDAIIFGIDIDPRCDNLVDPPNQARIGSQSDVQFLRGVVAEMGGLDIVLDDGSHIGADQRISFRTLFPLLREGGLYVIEDLHTSYFRSWKGGYRRKGTGVEFVKELIDDMHHWWHERPAGENDIGGIHFYDSLVFIEKGRATEPKALAVPETD